jgi:CelD/BcsL family acetyltransferase involved in cellulose biosynthesis
MLEVTTVRSEAEFAALKPEWDDVAGQTAPTSVFLTHDWFAAAWAWRRLDSTLNLLVARSGRRLVGALPLVRSRDRRRLNLLTVPDTQVTDMIATPIHGPAVADTFVKALTTDRNWDAMQLDFLQPEGSAMREFVPALRRHGFRFEIRDGGCNPFVRLSGSWDGYYAGRSRRLKKTNNLAANRLKKIGTIRVEWLAPDGADDATYDRVLDSAVMISGQSWKRDTGNALDQPGPNAFIRALSRAGRKNGWLSIWLIHVDDKPLAMEYQLIYAGNVHALRSDFAATCEEISPGTYLFRYLLESFFGRGLERYFMGPGENPYKMRWTDEVEPLRRIVVYNHSFRGRRDWMWESVLKPKLRHVRDRFLSPRRRVPETPPAETDGT